MMKPLTIGCALALGMGVFAGPSMAATAAKPPRSETVQYGDLNVATATGWRTLNGRLTLAARRVCQEPTASSGDPRAKIRSRACRVATIAAAQRAISERRGASLTQRHAL